MSGFCLSTEAFFGGLAFGGKELEIYEEVPAVFIDPLILGLKIVLQGYKGFQEEAGYTLSISSDVDFEGVIYKDFSLDDYLGQLLKTLLKDAPDIVIQ